MLCKQEVAGSIPAGSTGGSACKSDGFGDGVVLDWYSVSAESTAGEYHIGPYFAGELRFGGLQTGGCRFVPGWMEPTEVNANRSARLHGGVYRLTALSKRDDAGGGHRLTWLRLARQATRPVVEDAASGDLCRPGMAVRPSARVGPSDMRSSWVAGLGYALWRIVAVAVAVATTFPCSSLSSPAKNAT